MPSIPDMPFYKILIGFPEYQYYSGIQNMASTKKLLYQNVLGSGLTVKV